jgi:predicted DNA-binding transcriptional regulator AlpA
MSEVLPFARPQQATAAIAPLLVSAKDLAAMLGIGLRTLRAHDSAGRLPRPLRIGGRVVWRVSEIEAWVAAGAPPRSEWEARAART